MARIERWRVGRKVPLNVYDGDRPVCQCHDAEDAARIVEAMNGADQWASIDTAPRDGTKVLVGWPGIINMGRYDRHNRLWFCADTGRHFLPEQPTQWRPLPNPPSEIPNLSGDEVNA